LAKNPEDARRARQLEARRLEEAEPSVAAGVRWLLPSRLEKMLSGRHFDEALAQCNREVEEATDRERLGLAYAARAAVLQDSGRINEALADSTRAVELAPEYGIPFGLLGLALRDLGWLSEARAAFDRAVEIEIARNDVDVVLEHLHGLREEFLTQFCENNKHNYNPEIMDEAAVDLNAAADEQGVSRQDVLDFIKRTAAEATREIMDRAKETPCPDDDVGHRCRSRCELRLPRRHIDAVARLRTGHLLGERRGELSFAAAVMRQRQRIASPGLLPRSGVLPGSIPDGDGANA
jgi:tetratricopeptide (TPR) repeat protein